MPIERHTHNHSINMRLKGVYRRINIYYLTKTSA